MTLRDFIFMIWCNSGENVASTIAALKTIAANQYTIATGGGKVLLSASVNGQSYNYNIGALSPFQFVSYSRRAYLAIKDMTDSDLQTYLETQDDSFSTANFSNMDCR